jgi:photosystem II stability/assembly factor-like uncharacterized protein
MHKIFLVAAGIMLTAASCNFSDPFSFTAGSRGVFKSEDGGESFHAINNTQEREGGLNGVSVNSLVFDPSNSDVIYLGAGSGIYRTENGGKSWTYILTGMSVGDIALDRQGSIIYAGGLSGGNGKVIKSSDGGKNWTDVYTEPTKGTAVLSLAVSGSVVIAGLGGGEIIRSFDYGNTWQATKDFEDQIIKMRFGSSNTVYAMGKTTGLHKSTDSGSTWSAASSLLTQDNLSSSQTTVPPVSLFHDFALDARQSGVIYLGTEQGLYRSVNDGTSWNLISLPVRDVALKVSAVGVNPSNSNNVFVSIGFTMFKSVNGGLTWETRELRTEQGVRVIMVDPNASNIVYLGLGDKK